MTPDASLPPATACALCGHDPACGSAAGLDANDRQVPLCHADDHSCYHRWTLYRERPSADVQHPTPPLTEEEPMRPVVDPCQCGEKSCPALRGMIRDERGYWRWPTTTEILSDLPPLTEEELALVERSVEVGEFASLTPWVRRLIAALRAAKVEIANLRRALAKAEDHHADMHDEDHDD